MLDVRPSRVARHGWLPLLPRRWQWNAERTSPSCGLRRSFGWRTVEFLHHKPANPLQRMLNFVTRLRHRRRRMPRFYGKHRRRDGTLDLARLLADVPFPVYGLRDQPLGLRLRSPGFGGGRESIDHMSLGYVVGHPLSPERALELEQHGPVDADTRLSKHTLGLRGELETD